MYVNLTRCMKCGESVSTHNVRCSNCFSLLPFDTVPISFLTHDTTGCTALDGDDDTPSTGIKDVLGMVGGNFLPDTPKPWRPSAEEENFRRDTFVDWQTTQGRFRKLCRSLKSSFKRLSVPPVPWFRANVSHGRPVST